MDTAHGRKVTRVDASSGQKVLCCRNGTPVQHSELVCLPSPAGRAPHDKSGPTCICSSPSFSACEARVLKPTARTAIIEGCRGSTQSHGWFGDSCLSCVRLGVIAATPDAAQASKSCDTTAQTDLAHHKHLPSVLLESSVKRLATHTVLFCC